MGLPLWRGFYPPVHFANKIAIVGEKKKSPGFFSSSKIWKRAFLSVFSSHCLIFHGFYSLEKVKISNVGRRALLEWRSTFKNLSISADWFSRLGLPPRRRSLQFELYHHLQISNQSYICKLLRISHVQLYHPSRNLCPSTYDLFKEYSEKRTRMAKNIQNDEIEKEYLMIDSSQLKWKV